MRLSRCRVTSRLALRRVLVLVFNVLAAAALASLVCHLLVCASNVASSSSSTVKRLLRRSDSPGSPAVGDGPEHGVENEVLRAALPVVVYTPLQLALLVSVDGVIYAIDKQSGNMMWSQRSVGGPMVGVVHRVEGDDGAFVNTAEGTAATFSTPRYIPEPGGDGYIFVLDPATSPSLQKLPFTIKQLVSASPFASTDGRTVYVGTKVTRLYALDAATGAILRIYGGENAVAGARRDSLSDNHPAPASVASAPYHRDEILMARTEWKLDVYGRDDQGRRREWSITFAEFSGLSDSSILDLAHHSEAADAVVQEVLRERLLFSSDGVVKMVTGNSPTARWKARPSQQPIVAAIHLVAVDAPSPRTDSSPLRIRQLKLVQQLEFSTAPAENEQPSKPRSGSMNFFGKIKRWSNWVQNGPSHKRDSNEEAKINSGSGLSAYIGRIDASDTIYALSTVEASRSSAHSPKSECTESSNLADSCLVGRRHSFVAVLASSSEFPLRSSPRLSPYQSQAQSSQRSHSSSPSAVTHNFPWLYHIRRTPWRGLLTILSFVLLAIVAVVACLLRRGALFWARALWARDKFFRWRDPKVAEEIIPAKGGGGRRQRRKRGTGGGQTSRMANEPSYVSRVPGPISMTASRVVSVGGCLEKGDRIPDLVDASTASDQALSSSGSLEPFSRQPTYVSEKLESASIQLQINSLTVFEDVLGYGSHGTVVYRGRFEDRDVAVKRILLDFVDIAEHEVRLLQESDDHPNVVRYYCRERCDRFAYIAVELCHATLFDVIERPQKHPQLAAYVALSRKGIIRQIADGLAHLHALRIAHRDIKPMNILLSSSAIQLGDVDSHNRRYRNHPLRALLSDFGLCKRFDSDHSSFGSSDGQGDSGRAVTPRNRSPFGTAGWRAPESLNSLVSGELQNDGVDCQSPRLPTKAVDIFAAGCLFYYILTPGEHPFGRHFDREANIVAGRYNLSALDMMPARDAALAKDLVSIMIEHQPHLRPTIKQVLAHPFFWDPGRQLIFLQEASDRFELEPRPPASLKISALLTRLEENAVAIIGDDWRRNVDRILLDDLRSRRTYNGSSIRELLRAMRNKRHHYHELPEAARQLLGEPPDGFINYFVTRFPRLVMHVYTVVREDPSLRESVAFKPFFC